MELLVTVTFFFEDFLIFGISYIKSFWLILLGNGIVSSLNKTANDNNLDLAVLKNAIGHTILDVESLDEEMGKLKTWQSKILKNLIIFLQLTKKGEFDDSIVDVNEKLDGMNSMNKTIESNSMNMEAMNKSVEDNSLGLKVLNSTMGKHRNCTEF